MSHEILIMTLAGLLQLALMLAHGAYVSLAFGLAWGMGRRDMPRQPSDFGRRIERTLINNTENMAVFVPILVALAYARPGDIAGQTAATGFLIARVTFAVLYFANVPYIRTIIWFVGHTCVLTMVWAIAQGG